VTQGQRLQPIGPIVAGIVIGIVLFLVGKAVKDHFAFNAALCNAFNGTTAGCAGNTFAYDMGGIVEDLGIFVGIAGILAGLGLSVSARSKTAPAAGTRPASAAVPPRGASPVGGQSPASGAGPAGSRPPAAGVVTGPAPTGQAAASSSAVPASWIASASASPPPPEQSAEPLWSATEPGFPAGQ